MSDSSPISPEITSLVQILGRVSAELPATLSKELFDTTLFQSRSEYKREYLAEVRHNLVTLARLQPDGERYQWLSERCQAQVNAIVQLSLRNARKVKRSMQGAEAASLVRVSQRQYLQQELVKHHDYERRLKDNLYRAQEAAQASGDHNSVLVCQQRLIRCQHAIDNIERQLER